MPSLQIEVDDAVYQRYIAANPLQQQHIKKMMAEVLLLLSPQINNNQPPQKKSFQVKTYDLGTDISMSREALYDE